MSRLWRRGWTAALVISILVPHGALARITSDKQNELNLSFAAQAMNALRTPAAMIKMLPRKSDRDYLLKLLGESATQPVRVHYVEKRSVVVETADARAVVFVEDLERQRFQLNKHPFTIDPNESAEAAIKRIRRSLVGTTAVYRLIVPDAQANPALILGASAVEFLLSKYVGWAYLSGMFMLASLCVQTNQNSIGKCASLGAVWPLVLGWIGVGSVAAAIEKVKEKASPAAFDLEALSCSEKSGEPIRASMRDEKKNKLDIELVLAGAGGASVLTLKPENAHPWTVYLKPDMSIDTDKTTGGGRVIGPAAFDLIAKGAKSLAAACKDPSSRHALEDYLRKTKNETKVVPKIDESGVSAKTVK